MHSKYTCGLISRATDLRVWTVRRRRRNALRTAHSIIFQRDDLTSLEGPVDMLLLARFNFSSRPEPSEVELLSVLSSRDCERGGRVAASENAMRFPLSHNCGGGTRIR